MQSKLGRKRRSYNALRFRPIQQFIEYFEEAGPFALTCGTKDVDEEVYKTTFIVQLLTGVV